MSTTTNPFLPVLLLLLLALGVGIFTLFASGWLLPFLGFKPSNPQASKLTPYECGVPLVQADARQRYSVKFYLTAVLFILFDVEVAFLLPWAVNFRTATWTFLPILLFIATLLVGLIYVWGKGALEWER